MPGSVFISYRREDTAGHAGRLYDHLKTRFPERVFMDVGEIEPGTDFAAAIERGVGECAALVALIGPGWLRDGRLQDPSDFVRLEIATALKRGIVVIPALVQGTPLPAAASLPQDLAPLLRRQAISISDEDWDNGCERLIRALAKVVGPARKRPGPAVRWMLSLAGIAVAMSVVVVTYQPFGSKLASSLAWVGGKTPGDDGKAVEKSYGAATDTNDVARKIAGGGEPSKPADPAELTAAYFVGRWIAVGRASYSVPAVIMEFSADQKVVWRASPSGEFLLSGTWSFSDGQLVVNGGGVTARSRIYNRSADHFTATDATSVSTRGFTIGRVFDATRQ